MIDCDCQDSQLGVLLRRAPNKGLHRPLVTLAGFVVLGPASKTQRETLAFLISQPGPVLAQDVGSLSSEQRGARRWEGGTNGDKRNTLHTSIQPDTGTQMSMLTVCHNPICLSCISVTRLCPSSLS